MKRLFKWLRRHHVAKDVTWTFRCQHLSVSGVTDAKCGYGCYMQRMGAFHG